MLQRHALRTTRRPARVDRIRQVLRTRHQRRVRLAPLRDQIRLLLQHHHATRVRLGKHVAQAALRQHHERAALLQHVRQPVRWVLGIERHHRAPRLQHRQPAHHNVDPAVQQHRHRQVRVHAQEPQEVRQLVRALVQLAVRHRRVAQHDGRRVRGALHLLLHQLVDHGIVSPLGGGVVDADDEVCLLGVAQHRQLRHSERWITHGSLEQAEEMISHALHGGALEERRVVLEGTSDTASSLCHHEGEIELRMALNEPNRRQLQGTVAKRQGHVVLAHEVGCQPLVSMLVGLLQNEHEVEEGRTRRVAIGLEPLDKQRERHQLMVQRRHRLATHPRQQITELQVSRHIGAHDNRVDAVSHHLLGRDRSTASHGGANGDI
mmetsp:Transcript_19849/g.63042  ORF Transcript_19849/g.63042 Transcript_19849/m.63042 type:complete len:377 (-) Transcript_19849:2907-4037(-)